jgi:hypothetical protein
MKIRPYGQRHAHGDTLLRCALRMLIPTRTEPVFYIQSAMERDPTECEQSVFNYSLYGIKFTFIC